MSERRLSSVWTFADGHLLGAIGCFNTHRSLITDELKTIETAYRRHGPLPLDHAENGERL